MDTRPKPEPLEVKCGNCGAKTGEYIGPIGYTEPVRSRYYRRVDGTSPVHGGSTEGKCPACGLPVNELLDVMNAISEKLARQTAAEVLSETPKETGDDAASDHGP